jgi:hypothetical protein
MTLSRFFFNIRVTFKSLPEKFGARSTLFTRGPADEQPPNAAIMVRIATSAVALQPMRPIITKNTAGIICAVNDTFLCYFKKELYIA